MGSGQRLSYYDALGVERNASPDEIRAAYKKQSLALHPDKNPYGNFLMKYINEAHAVLSDGAKRARYDRDGDGGDRGGNGRGRDRSAAVIRGLQQKLADSEQKRSVLKQNVVNLKSERIQLKSTLSHLREEVNTSQEKLSLTKSLLSEKSRENKQLQNKVRYSGQEKIRIQNEVDYLKTENDILERENNGSKRRLDLYQEKMEKAGRELREERLRAGDELARAEERARGEMELVRTAMTKRSVCYRCDGEAASKEECALCEGNVTIQGIWTRCHKCDGKGTYMTVGGKEEGCDACSSRGAREGIHSATCFRCKGRGEGCIACRGGRIRGFNLQLCPFCRGEGGECENCRGTARVSCRCGLTCKGHGPNEVAIPAAPSSLQRRLASADGDGRDWAAKFLTRDWSSPLPCNN